jgi:hypothetical protein
MKLAGFMIQVCLNRVFWLQAIFQASQNFGKMRNDSALLPLNMPHRYPYFLRKNSAGDASSKRILLNLL